MIMVSATLANHMGLIEAVEDTIGYKLPILNCSKCATHWITLIYTLLCGVSIIQSVAISLLSAYCAMWLELILGIFVTFYNCVYEDLLTTKAPQDKDTENQVS